MSLVAQYEHAIEAAEILRSGIGPDLRRRRERAKFGLRQFARRARVDAPTLSLVERGQHFHLGTARKASRELERIEAKAKA